jgi:hypothetical protein
MDKKTLVGALFMIGLLISVIVWRNVKQNDLKKNGTIVQAKILRVNLGGKVGGGFECLINYKNTEIKLPSVSSLLSGKYKFVGKIFPARYSPNSNTLEILITPEDFGKFNIPFPDSLNWVSNNTLKL